MLSPLLLLLLSIYPQLAGMLLYLINIKMPFLWTIIIIINVIVVDDDVDFVNIIGNFKFFTRKKLLKESKAAVIKDKEK